MIQSRRGNRKDSSCPDRSVLVEFILGRLPVDELEQVAAQVENCPDCQDVLETLDALEDSTIRGLREASRVQPASWSADLEERIRRAEQLCHEIWNEQKSDLSDAPPSSRLGPYELHERIGRGGMGAVYRATHSHLKRPVAVKLLRSHRLSDEQAVARFRREMEAVGRLDHPHLVRAHDAGQVDGQHFLAMELIDGVDLSRLIRRSGPLPVADACEVVRQAAVGLQHAHEHGLVHRDVKPSNLMLTRAGVVRVLDLGLARIVETTADAGDDGELTGTGRIVGTGDFLAPEQAEDTRGADPRSDVYALGCTLYFLLIGRAPFSGPKYGTLGRKLLAHVHEIPQPIRKLRSDVPPGLARVLETMLAKKPEQRPQTAAAVAEALWPFTTSSDLPNLIGSRGEAPREPPEHPQVGPRRSRFIPLLLLLAVVILPLGYWYGGTVVMFQQGEGVLVVTGEKDGVTLIARSKTGESTPLHIDDEGHVRLEAGQYDIRLPKSATTIAVQPSRVTVRRGETIVVEVRRRPSPARAEGTRRVLTPKSAEGEPALPEAITNALGMQLHLVPAGKFMMGSADDPDARADERPQHRVVITRPFYMGRHEVTVGQFRQFVQATDYKTEAERDSTGGWQANGATSFGKRTPGTTWKNPGFEQTDKHPVTVVSWNDAVAFCRWLSEKEDRTYRLPTEAEWEYACRAGTTTIRPIGKMPLKHYGWLLANAGLRTWPVGKRLPNPWGLYDMLGNAREWCGDWYAADYYVHSPAEDPAGPESSELRVVRGSCFMDLPPFARSAWRGRLPSDEGINNQGFRVVREITTH